MSVARERTVKCKNCGTEFTYSEYSYQSKAAQGHSRPEYCNNCREIQDKRRTQTGSSYYGVQYEAGESPETISIGLLGKVFHPDRPHVLSEHPSGYDPSKFGITDADVRAVFDWLDHPQHQVVVVKGPTGSGKSTVLPYRLIEPPSGYANDHFTRFGQVIVTQPRIEAARTIPEFVGGVLVGSGFGKGTDVGYRYSGDHNYDNRNRLVYVTDGTLINWIVSGEIENFSVIVIDEAHERSLNIDLILGLLKTALPRYPHLSLIIASATIDTDLFLQYYGKNTATLVEFQGMRKFNVVTHYANEDALPYDNLTEVLKIAPEAVGQKVLEILDKIVTGEKEKGDILAFLQGVRPIEDAIEYISSRVEQDKRLAGKVNVLPLHMTLTVEERKRALEKDPNDPRIKVVVSTNAAETSLTVEGIVYVVETGLLNESQWDIQKAELTVPTILHSRAGCIQRWGRAGRVRDGEAHCLYSEEQFNNLFPEYTIPAIRRSPLDNIILTAKAAGIDNISSFDWIEPPDKLEIERSRTSLQSLKILGEDERLTDFGEQLRTYPFETELANLMFLADQFGCAIEMATLLPIIKPGGITRLLEFNRDWSVHEKLQARRVHDSLMQGCHDDIEFLLKLYQSWSQLSSFVSTRLNPQEQEKQLARIRTAWAEQFYLIESAFSDTIEPERESLIQRISQGTAEEERRAIDFQRLDRIRYLMGYIMPEQRPHGIAAGTPYTFNPRDRERIEGSTATYTSVLKPAWLKSMEEIVKHEDLETQLAFTLSPMNRGDSDPETRNRFAYSRIFLDQQFPLGHSYKLQVAQDGSIQILQWLSGPDNGNDDGVFDQVRVRLNLRYLVRLADAVTAKPGTTIDAVVTGYDFTSLDMPVVMFGPSNKQAFSTITNRIKVSSRLNVEVTGYSMSPDGFADTLIAQEKSTGYEIVLDRKDVSFSSAGAAITSIPIGTTISVVVTAINKKDRVIEASCLPIVEEHLNGLLSDKQISGRKFQATGQVIDIYSDNTDSYVTFLLDWSEPGQGIIHAVRVMSRRLHKEVEAFAIGQQYYLTLQFADRKVRGKLEELPSEVADLIGQKGVFELLTWSNGTLEARDRMTYELVQELTEPTKNNRYIDTVYYLYRRGYDLQAYSSELIWEGSNFSEGDEVEGSVISILDYGVIVAITDQLTAMLHISDMRGSNINIAETFSINDIVRGYISQIDVDKRSLSISTKPSQEEWTYITSQQYPVGSFISNVPVVNIEKFGAFVELSPGFTGLVPLTNMSWDYVEDPNNIVSKGDLVDVYIVGLDEDNMNIELSFIDKSDDPLTHYSEGMTVTGEVSGVTQYGVFVAIESGISGLLHVKNMRGFVADPNDHFAIGDTIPDLLITSIDRSKRRLSFSNELTTEQWQEIVSTSYTVGTIYSGLVTSVSNKIGAFVQLEPGIQGLVFRDKMSWGGTDEPEEILTVGEYVDVEVTRIDIGNQKIALSMLSNLPDPFYDYDIGDETSGTVVKILGNGILVELEAGVTGMVHISKISTDFVDDISNFVSEGDTVEVSVIDVDGDRRRLSLSMI